MSVIATGFFDGVHLGHRSVIEALLKMSRERGEESLVLTFWPHPRAVLQNDARTLRLLTSQDEKLALLREMGVDRVEVLPFDGAFSSLTAREYLRDIAVGRYGASAVVLGYDNRIGSDCLGPDESVPVARELGLETCVVGAAGSISSTRIRNLVSAGYVQEAAEMLGRPYELRGVVVSGNQLGRTIGFPTANSKLYEPLKVLPAVGAYFTEVHTVGGVFNGMTNIDRNGKIETHIFGFDSYIYGRDITIKFLRHLRDERSFGSLEELKAQLLRDKENCVVFIK